MNVSLTSEHEEYVRGKVTSGKYASASEVVREGLRLLQERDTVFEAKLRRLRSEVDEGWRQSQAGELVDGSAAREEAMQRVRERVTRHKKA